LRYKDFYKQATKKETALSENVSVGIEVTIEEWRILLDILSFITETDFRHLISEMAKMEYYLCNVQCNQQSIRLVFSMHEFYRIT